MCMCVLLSQPICRCENEDGYDEDGGESLYRRWPGFGWIDSEKALHWRSGSGRGWIGRDGLVMIVIMIVFVRGLWS